VASTRVHDTYAQFHALAARFGASPLRLTHQSTSWTSMLSHAHLTHTSSTGQLIAAYKLAHCCDSTAQHDTDQHAQSIARHCPCLSLPCPVLFSCVTVGSCHSVCCLEMVACWRHHVHQHYRALITHHHQSQVVAEPRCYVIVCPNADLPMRTG
jgi:hypothetical protein